MLGGAVLMGVLAALFRTEVIADAGAPRNAISLVLGGIAAVDAAIGLGVDREVVESASAEERVDA